MSENRLAVAVVSGAVWMWGALLWLGMCIGLSALAPSTRVTLPSWALHLSGVAFGVFLVAVLGA